MHVPTHARFPRAVRMHLISRTDTTLSECGVSLGYAAKFRLSDLPSGERTAKLCERCRTKTYQEA